MNRQTIVGAALRILSPLAPRGRRKRWLREWEGELAHWVREGGGGWVPTLRWIAAAGRDALTLRRLGSRERRRAAYSARRERRAEGPAQALFQDFRYSVRTLRSAPGFSLVTVLTLALGIGATLAMFGVLHDIYLKPLPFPEPNRLVVGRTTVQGHLNPWVTGADYYDFRDQSTVFSGLGAILPYPMDVTVSGAGEAERASANVGSPNLFGILGVVPRTGRLFRAEDGLEGAADVVILTHETWLRRFGGDPSVVGSALDLDGDPYTVVGILPEGFFFMSRADLWIPMRPDRLAAASRDMHNWYLVGRLRPGVTLDQAQAGVDVVAARLADAWPETNRNKGLLLTELHRVLTEEVRTRLLVLSLAVGLVLLIASANGAAILLARAPARSFEISIRAAMGAPRLRLLRQLMAESLGLALAGGLLGTGLAVWLRGVILRYLAMERLGLPEPSLSFPLLGAAVGLSLMTGLASGLYPAWCSARVPVQQGLKAGNRGFGDAGSRFRSGLVIIQVALSVLLLAGSGVLLRSLANLQGLDPGFDSRDLLTAEVQIPAGRYPDAPSRNRYFQELLSEVQALPGVESASLTSHLPIGDPGNIYRAHAQGDGEDPQRVFLRSVYPGFFETLGIPLLEGRDVEGDFRNDQSWVVILGRTAADRLFPGEDPLGKVVELQLVPTPRPMEVVGVVGDARLTRLEEAPEAALYVPYAQRSRSVMRLAIRTRTPPERVAGALREIVSRLDPEVPLSRVATLSGLVRSSLAERRVMTLSLTLLALLPLVLAAVGLFAVLAYHVSRRSHEIGVRMALGAAAPQVGGMVLVQGMRLAGVGAALGLGGAVVGTRLLRGLLFGVGANDPLTLVLVTGLVLAVATLACAVPVWRAVGSDPRVALAAE